MFGLDAKWTPWIVGGGIVAVLYFLFFSGGSSGSQSSGQVGYSAAQLDLVAQQANLSAQVEQARIAAESTDTATLAGVFGNLMAAKYGNEQALATVAAGTQQTQIQTNAAIKIERMNNITQRIGIRNGTKQVIAGDNAAVQTAQIQANMATAIAQLQAAVQQQGQTLGFFSQLLSPLMSLFGGGNSQPMIGNGYANAAQNAGGG